MLPLDILLGLVRRLARLHGRPAGASIFPALAGAGMQPGFVSGVPVPVA